MLSTISSRVRVDYHMNYCISDVKTQPYQNPEHKSIELAGVHRFPGPV